MKEREKRREGGGGKETEREKKEQGGEGQKWSTTYRQVVMLHCCYHAELPRSERMSPGTKEHSRITILNTDRI